MGKVLDHVDLESGTLYARLKQIRCSDKDEDYQMRFPPPITQVWCGEFLPTKTQDIVKIIKDKITGQDPQLLLHLKRFCKSEHSIRAIICSTEHISEIGDVETILGETSQDVKLFVVEVPLTIPMTKEISQKWSKEYWPMSWKGNPNHQYLSAIELNVENEKRQIKHLLCNWIDGSLVTVIARENEGDIHVLTVAINNGSSSPYDHSVIKAIGCISKTEKEKRSLGEERNYLCHNLVVYTTHEPCVMCCMALVHSRISRIIYLKESPKSGGLESNYQLGDRGGLNWKFDIWKWIPSGEKDDVDNLLEEFLLKVENSHVVNY